MAFPTTEETASQDTLFAEAVQSLRTGDRARGKDLLVRLLQKDRRNADYWVWMSAAVDSRRERLGCLKNACEIDPHNAAARRGLAILGTLPPDSSTIVPAGVQKRGWQRDIQRAGAQKQTGRARAQVALMLLAGLALAGIAAFVVFGDQLQHRPAATTARRATYTAIVSADTPTPAEIIVADGSPTPLWMLIDATFTPTPLYINTPHAASEAYRIGIRALQREDWSQSQTYFRQAATDIAKVEPAAKDVQYYIGENFLQLGEWDNALTVFDEVIAAAPDFAPAYAGRARARLAQSPETLEPAITDFQTALNLDPNFVEARLVLADLYLQASQPEMALEVLESGEGRDQPLADLYRAQAYLTLEQPEQSLVYARRANRADPTLLEGYHTLGLALQATGAQIESREPFRMYLLYQPDDAQAWFALAQAHLAAEDHAAALEALEQSMQHGSPQPGAVLLRAQLYYQQGQMEKAHADYQTAVRQQPTSYPASLGLGITFLALEEPGKAWDRFERTRSLAETPAQKAEILYWRAQSLDALGEVQAALRDYRALLELPEDVVQPEWTRLVVERMAALATPTATVRAPLPTSTRTPVPTPSRTSIPTKKP